MRYTVSDAVVSLLGAGLAGVSGFLAGSQFGGAGSYIGAAIGALGGAVGGYQLKNALLRPFDIGSTEPEQIDSFGDALRCPTTRN